MGAKVTLSMNLIMLNAYAKQSGSSQRFVESFGYIGLYTPVKAKTLS